MTSGKKYDEETKARAVRLFLDRVDQGDVGVSAAYKEIAGLLGISPDTLRVWVRQAGKKPGQKADETVAAENARLRRENAQLRQANEILKTASAFLSQRRSSTAHSDDSGLYSRLSPQVWGRVNL